MKKNNSVFRVSLFVGMVGSFLFFHIISCSSGDTLSSSGSTSGVTSIDQLPRATSPVSSTSASVSSLRSNSIMRMNDVSGTNSMNLATLSSATFNSDSSIAACVMSNKVREAIRHAAKGDKIQCYVAQVVKDNPNISIDPYDGIDHVFALSSDAGGPGKARLKINRDSSGNITRFEMAACGGGGNTGSDTQSEYLLQTIQNNAFNMVSKEKHEGGGNQNDDSSGEEAVTVTGTLNGGAFVDDKTIDVSAQWQSDSRGTFQTKARLLQTSDTISYSGFETGDFVFTGGSGSFSDRIYSIAGLTAPSASNTLDYTILGGAAHAIISGSQTGSQGDHTWNEDRSQGWNPDTTVSTTTPFLALLTQDPPPITSVDTVSFTGDEVFDCASTPDASVVVDETSLQTACANLELDNQGYVNCFGIIQGQN